MSSDDTPTKSESTPRESTAKAASAPSEGAAKPAKTDAPTPEAPKTQSGAPSSYSRGEGQKPVTQAYKDNWNNIFGEKPKPTGSRTASPPRNAKVSKSKATGAKPTRRR